VFLVQIAKLATNSFCSSQQFSVQIGNCSAWQQEGKVSGRRRRGSQGVHISLSLRIIQTPQKDPKKVMALTLSSPPTSSTSSLLSS